MARQRGRVEESKVENEEQEQEDYEDYEDELEGSSGFSAKVRGKCPAK